MKKFRNELPPAVVEEDRRNLLALKRKFKTYTNVGIRIGLPRHTASATVCNWVRRGIPYKYKVMFPELFMPHLMAGSQDAQSSQKESP